MIKITILVDSKVLSSRPRGIKAEWGFSALIEASETILFDAGQSVAFDNFVRLKKPFPDKIVLSHEHYDHTSGLLPFLGNNILYAHPDAFLPRYHEGRYIGIPFKKGLIETAAEVVEINEPVEISKGIWALGEIPREFETTLLKDSFLIRNGKKEKDNILDDQGLVIKSPDGGILLLGCCHSGLRNTIKWAEEVIDDEIRFIIGGTHLIAHSEEKIRDIMKSIKFDFIAPCHCTGFKSEFLLMSLMKDKFKPIGSGSEIEIF